MNSEHTINQHILLLYDELDESKSELVKSHLQICDTCKSDYESLNETFNVYKMLPLEQHSLRRIDWILSEINKGNDWLLFINNLYQKFHSYKLTWRLAIPLALFVIIIMIILTFTIDRNNITINYQRDMNNISFNSDFYPASFVFMDSLDIISQKIRNLETGAVFIHTNHYKIKNSETVIDGEIRNLNNRINNLIDQIKIDEF